MRFIGGLIVLSLAVLAFRWCAGEIAVQTFGRETRAQVSSVSKSSGRRASYTAHYDFVTEDMGKGYGSCPSHRGAESSGVSIRYLRQDPSWNTPTVWWYAGFLIVAFGAMAWPLALWSARIFLFRRIRRVGESEEDEDAEDEEDEETEGEETEEKAVDVRTKSAKTTRLAPLAAAVPVPFRNTWSAAILFSFGLSALAIAANLVWFDIREKAVSQSAASTLSPLPTLDGPAAATVALPRGASAGNVANGSTLGFDGDAFYFGLWRNYDNPSAPPPGLYRFALDGSGRAPVGNPSDTETIFTGIQVKDDWIYYRAMQGIYRIRKDGKKVRQLTENDASSMAVVGDWVYYQHKVLDGAIYRMRLDGGGEEKLCSESVGEMCVADDGWIYYANKTDRDQLWRMKVDGEARARLSKRRVGKLLAAGGSVWFTDLDNNSALSRMDLSGAGVEVVAKDSVSALNWADGRIYFNRENGQAARCKPDGSELETVAPAAAEILIRGKYLFVRPDFEAKAFRRSRLDGSEPKDIRF